MTVANQIIIEAVDDKAQPLKLLLNDYVASVLLEKGCQKFELYQLDEEREQFFIVEIWKSAKSYNNHLTNEIYLDLNNEMNDYIKTQTCKPLKLTQCLTKLGLKEKKESK